MNEPILNNNTDYIVIERHYVPLNVYLQMYNTNNMNNMNIFNRTSPFNIRNNIGINTNANMNTANTIPNIIINAGHDLNLENLSFFAKEIPNLKEVSIGHAIISDAIYLGLENTVQMYNRLLIK